MPLYYLCPCAEVYSRRERSPKVSEEMYIVSKPALALATVAMSVLCACGGGRHDATEVYFLVAANTKIAYWQEAAEGLRSAARDLGVKSEMAGPETYDPKAEKEEFLAVVH